MKIFIYAVIMLFLFFDVDAQLVTKKQALKDLTWCKYMLESIHPSLYRYTPKSKIDSVFNEIERRCKEYILDSIDSYYIPAALAQFNYFFDIHTKVFPNNFTYKAKKIFPPVVWSENRNLFLWDENIEVLSINGVKVDSLIDWLFCLQGKESNPKQNYIIWTLGPWVPWCLDWHGIFPPYRIEAKTRNNRDTLMFVDGLEEREVRAKRLEIATKLYAFPSGASGDIFLGGNPPYKFQIYPEESVAIIRYNEAFWPEDYPKIDSLIHRFFQDCDHHNIEYLFIDFSRNEGGGFWGYEIFGPYLKFKRKRYKRLYLTKGGVQSWRDLSIENRTNRGVEPFRGQIFVYQSSYTGSATSMFCSVLKATTNALLVGTETGQGIPLTGGYDDYPFPYSSGFLRIPKHCQIAESPVLRRDSNGYLLPDIPYPFLTARWLDVEDCKKIIRLKKTN